MPDWKSYEEVARHLLNQFASEFGIDRVEGKQTVVGERSNTEWEIDAKGVKDGNGGFMIVECRRYTTSKQKQEHLGALAYRIIDTNASGAIVVSPLGFQTGAQKIADAENVFDVRLTPESTTRDFTLKFLNKFIVASTLNLSITGSSPASASDSDGNRIEDGDVDTENQT